MIARSIEKKIRHLLTKYPIVTLTGPRQSGKSTLLRNSFGNYEYVSLEDPDKLLLAKEDPRLFLSNFHGKTIIDEIQKLPELFSYIQTYVDTINKTGMYLLSGSHNFLLMERISQTLAGRTAILKLLPFSYNELTNGKIAYKEIDKLLYTGGYPRIYDKKIAPHEFYPFYIQTYVERDVRLMKNITDSSLFIRFLKLCAGRIGQLLNLSSLANDCGISQPTAQAWMSVLEASYIIFLLKPHSNNYRKRLVKSPKLYFYDTGLACSLLGLNSEKQLAHHYIRGSLFENWIILEYIKRSYNHASEPNIFFWRDNTGNELDLLIDNASGIQAVEIKSGLTFSTDFYKGLNYWQKLSNANDKQKTLVYGGDKSQATRNGRLISWKDWGLGKE
jgi:uncharacterized protein